MAALGRAWINDRIAQMSLETAEEPIYPAMSKTRTSATLYRLIEAGQLAHKALLLPLLDRGLEAGDDALLFALHGRNDLTEPMLADALGVPAASLASRIDRLVERDLVARITGEAEMLALTERGARLEELLADTWTQLEDALFGELEPKRRRHLDKALRRVVDLLQLP